MKKTILSLMVGLIGISAMAAEQIECVSSRGEKLTLKKYVSTEPTEKGWFTVTLAEGLSCGMVGEITDRVVEPEKSTRADVLSDWDGSSGVKISMRKGFLSSGKGAKTKAFVKVNYNDIDTDSASHTVTCTIVR